ncbi:MAG: ATP-dependent metallopeptidase FtsH/Yme1/Tma family protein [Bacteroidota bacterium]
MASKTKPANPKNGNSPATKEPKSGFGFYWIYIVVAVVLLGIQFLNPSSSVKTIAWKEFSEIYAKGEVEKLVGYKQDELYYIEVHLTDAAMKS